MSRSDIDHPFRPYCYDVEDCLDGYTVHAETCARFRQPWWGVNRNICPQEGRWT